MEIRMKKVIKQMFILLIGVLVLNTSSLAYYEIKDGYKVFGDNDLIDKRFNMYTALFCAIASVTIEAAQ